ncbi:MAG TPA: hypothetical protein VGF55_07620 [Gemmataceae bacterium]
MTRRALFACLIVLPAAGCGRGPTEAAAADPDGSAVAELVTQVEGARDARRATKLFAAGAVPPADRLKKLAAYSLAPGRPAVAGDAATLKIRLTDNRTGADAGEVEWSFVKENGSWKIKTAPLP